MLIIIVLTRSLTERVFVGEGYSTPAVRWWSRLVWIVVVSPCFLFVVCFTWPPHLATGCFEDDGCSGMWHFDI